MISVSELFKIGIGPSSSHTVGPMKAANAFLSGLRAGKTLPLTRRLQVKLFGSLAFTGMGHGTDKAVVLGLFGSEPATVDPDEADGVVKRAQSDHRLSLDGRYDIGFDPQKDIVFDRLSVPPRHPNTLSFSAYDSQDRLLLDETWCSVGGGFVVREGEEDQPQEHVGPLPYPFKSAAKLLDMGARAGVSIAEIVRANELTRLSPMVLDRQLAQIAEAMMACIDRGLAAEGLLPGGLNVRRRAKALHTRIAAGRLKNRRAPHEALDDVSAFAIGE
jgi:L-serine dehydratase